MKKNLTFCIVGFFLTIFFSFLLPSFTFGNPDTLCSYAGPDLSEDLLRLTNFSITGPSSLKEGDTITIKFKLQNFGQYDLKLGQKGIFVAVRDPNNSDVSFTFTRTNTILKVGETISIEATKVLDKDGNWKIWPSYQISLANGEKLGPDNWHVCSLQVGEIAKDSDQDGISDEKDNCPNVYNPDQKNSDGDSLGDVCDDSDQDGVMDDKDNCPFVPNSKQEDFNKNGVGDACEQVTDSDKDGVPDQEDNCPQNYNPQQEDIDRDDIGNVCDSCDDRDSDQDRIKNCLDKCPKEKETFNNYQDDDGCPDLIPEAPAPIERTVTVHIPTSSGPQPRTINTPTRDVVIEGPIMSEGFYDDDGDGVINFVDDCPSTPRRKHVFDNGCRCRDDDGGLNFYQQGMVTYLRYDNTTRQELDYCRGSSTLAERRCNPGYEDGSSDISIETDSFDCPFGCEDGECNNEMYVCSSPLGTCSDGIQNQRETGIDCGGECPPCNSRCTTGTKYAPSDTPCTSNYALNFTGDPYRLDYTWTNSNSEYVCQYYEICHRDLDFVIEEALECCSKTTLEEVNTTVDPALCMEALTLGATNCKKCVGLYIIKGLGTYARWMRGYRELGADSVPTAERLVNVYRTGVCRDYSLAVTTLLRKAGYSQQDIGNWCDGAHCYNVVRFPGDTKWHVVDTTGNNHDVKLGQLPSGYRYCDKLNESNWAFKVRTYSPMTERYGFYLTGPISDIEEYWRIVDSGGTYVYPNNRPVDSPIIWSCDDKCGIHGPCPLCGIDGPCPAGISCLPQSGPGIAVYRDNFRIPDWAPPLSEIIGCN